MVAGLSAIWLSYCITVASARGVSVSCLKLRLDKLASLNSSSTTARQYFNERWVGLSYSVLALRGTKLVYPTCQLSIRHLRRAGFVFGHKWITNSGEVCGQARSTVFPSSIYSASCQCLPDITYPFPMPIADEVHSLQALACNGGSEGDDTTGDVLATVTFFGPPCPLLYHLYPDVPEFVHSLTPPSGNWSISTP